jgi:drug/metabolite transporter (DMT)-like permease
MSTATADTSPPHLPRIDLRRGSIAMGVSMLCFTANSLLLKYFATQRHIDPWVSMSFRFGIGLLITIAMFSPGGTLHLRRSFQSWLMASRGILGGLGTAAYYTSIGPLGAGKATLIGNTWCVFAAIMAAFALKEKLTLSKVLGIVLALSGLSLLTGLAPWSFASAGKYELVSLVGAVLAAMVVVVIRQLTRTESSATIFASQCIYGLMLAVPLAAQHALHLSGMDFLLIALAALFAGFGQLGMTEGFRYLTVAAGGAFQITLPLIISLASVGLFGEHFTWPQIIGGTCILLGSFQTVVGWGRRKVLVV